MTLKLYEQTIVKRASHYAEVRGSAILIVDTQALGQKGVRRTDKGQ